VKLTLQQVTTLHDDSLTLRERVSVRPVAQNTADLRFTLDNPCGFHLRVEARESPQRVLVLQPIGAWPGHGNYICPGLVNLQTYAATLTGLRAGEWRVRADTLTQFPVPGFVIR